MIVNPIVWGNGGDTPQEKEVLINGFENSSIPVITLVKIGGEEYEPQS